MTLAEAADDIPAYDVIQAMSQKQARAFLVEHGVLLPKKHLEYATFFCWDCGSRMGYAGDSKP